MSTENELTEMWRDYKQSRQEKKHSNKDNSTATLDRNNIKYASHNNGVHLVIEAGQRTIDYWPSTGKFLVRPMPPSKRPIPGRGIRQLLACVKSYTNQPTTGETR